jgi:hypothetical protein
MALTEAKIVVQICEFFDSTLANAAGGCEQLNQLFPFCLRQ